MKKRQIVSFLLAVTLIVSLVTASPNAALTTVNATAEALLVSPTMQFELQYTSYEPEVTPSEYKSAQATTLFSSNVSAEDFLNDCSTDYAFSELAERDNAVDLQALYKQTKSALEEVYLTTRTIVPEYLNGIGDAYILGNVSYAGLNIKTEDLIDVYQRVLADHPLFFFSSGTIYYNGTYMMLVMEEPFVSGKVRQNYVNQIASKIKSFEATVASANGNHELAKLVHNRILDEASYAYESDGITPVSNPFTHNISGYVKDGKVVCDGYSKTYSAILNYLDVACILVTGWAVKDGTTTSPNMSHAWNLIQLDDGNYYFADLTWDDNGVDTDIYFAKGQEFYETHSVTKKDNSELFTLVLKMPAIPKTDYHSSVPTFYKSEDPTFTSKEGVTYTWDTDTKTLAFHGNGPINSNEISSKNPWNVYAKKAEHLVIDEGITYIPYFSFSSFSKLKTVEFPEGLTGIGQQAFDHCSSLQSVDLPDGMSYFGSQMFADCGKLTRISIGKGPENSSVVYASTNMFQGAKSLKEITVAEGHPAFYAKDGILFTTNHGLYCYPAGLKATTYTIPEDVTTIHNWAFYGCHNLTSIIIPETVTTVGSISDCDGLTSITFPSSVQNFLEGFATITLCDKLKTITNKSSAPLSLEMYQVGDQTVYWKNTVTGKYVTEIANGTVKANYYGERRYYGEEFTIDGVQYYICSEPKELTLNEMSQNKVRANVEATPIAGKTTVPSVVVHNGWRYKVVKTHVYKPQACKNVKAKLYGHDDIHVYWSKVSNVAGYAVYYKKASAKSYKRLGYTTKTYTKSLKNLADGTKYTIKIVPYRTVNGKKYAAPAKYVSIYTLKKVSTPKISKYSSKKVKVKWTNINGESGYQISRSTKKTGTNIVSTYKTTSKSSKTVNATRKKTYYYKVRAYKTVDGKKIYGPWSNAKAYKLK